MRKNPELEPLRQSVVVYNLVLASPATALVPNCNSFAVPLDQSVTWRGGTCYVGNIRSSIYHRPGIHPNLHHTQTQLHYKLERTLQLRLAVLTQHGEQQLPVIKPATGRPYVRALSLSGTVPAFTCDCLRFVCAFTRRRKFDLCVSTSSRTMLAFGNNVSLSSSECSTLASCRR